MKMSTVDYQMSDYDNLKVLIDKIKASNNNYSTLAVFWNDKNKKAIEGYLELKLEDCHKQQIKGIVFIKIGMPNKNGISFKTSENIYVIPTNKDIL